MGAAVVRSLGCCALLCCLTACQGYSVEVARQRAGHPGEDGGAATPVPWGVYAASLDVPACDPSFEVLVVDTTADTLDGGDTIADPSEAGPELSLVEAFWIGANRQRPHTITFDPRVFPVDAPATILLSGQHPFPLLMGELFQLCLDGRDRGVVIAWSEELGYCARCVWGWRAGSLFVGLTIRNQPGAVNTGAGQIAGCRVHSRYDPIVIMGPTLVGPGNVFAGANHAITVQAFSPGSTISGNFFDHDPLLGEVEANGVAILMWSEADVADNVFARAVWSAVSIPAAQQVTPTLRGNAFGVSHAGAPLAPALQIHPWIDVTGGSPRIGPGNLALLQGNAFVQCLGDAVAVELIRNSVFGQGTLLFGAGASLPAAPQLLRAGPDHVEGSCAVPGRVEVFSDPGALAETFIGEVACDAISPWRLEAAVPRGRNVTATLTDAERRSSELSAPLAVP